MGQMARVNPTTCQTAAARFSSEEEWMSSCSPPCSPLGSCGASGCGMTTPVTGHPGESRARPKAGHCNALIPGPHGLCKVHGLDLHFSEKLTKHQRGPPGSRSIQTVPVAWRTGGHNHGSRASPTSDPLEHWSLTCPGSCSWPVQSQGLSALCPSPKLVAQMSNVQTGHS